MFVPGTYMKIEQQGEGRSKVIEFNYLVQAVITENIEQLTDQARITIPKKLSWQGQSITDLIRRGDRVTLQAGYNGRMHDVFSGYVTSVSAKIPVVINCDNEMYALKQITSSVSYASVNLQQLCADILPAGMQYKADDVQLGAFRTKNNPSIPKVFEELKKYGLVAYFRGSVLYVGKLYWPDYQVRSRFIFSGPLGNVPASGNSLEFRRKDEIKLKVKAISINAANQRLEKEVGDTDGEQRTLYYYNINAVELERRATAEMEKLKYDGYKGSFTAFGEPIVFKGDVVDLTDPDYPERDGSYSVKAVTRSIGYNDGIRQQIELHYRS